jgi:ribosome maturation factor RimP
VTPLEQTIEALIAPAVATAGFELVRVRLSGNEQKTLQIMAERPDKTMSAEDCATLSRALSPLLDEKDPIPGQYRLEVSSPGIDRPLVRLSDYHDWQGYEAKIELDRLVDGRKKFSGVLGGIDGEAIILDIAGEEDAAHIPFAWIKSGKLALSDELIRESLKAAKAAQQQEIAGADAVEDQGDHA